MTRRFLRGNSVSSMQTEGAYNIDGKGKSVYDVRKASEDTSDRKVAIDEYHRYPEDIRLMKEMGMNCYRFQISRSRVFPKGFGQINKKALEYYNNLINELIKNDIEPMICLYHFDMPLDLAEKYNGFSSKFVVEKFFEFAKAVIDEFHDKVKYRITFNEQNLYAGSGAFLFAGSKLEKNLNNLYQIEHNVFLAHALVSNYINDTYPDLKIGGMLAYVKLYPETCNPLDNYLTMECDKYVNKLFLDVFTGKGYPKYFTNYLRRNNISVEISKEEMKEIERVKSDYISFSYYRSAVVSSENKKKEYSPFENYLVENKYLDRNEWGREIDPLGLRIMANEVYSYTNLPLFIIENGIGLREQLPENGLIEDDQRIFYHKTHIKNMLDAVNLDGVEFIGYLGRGLIDILSSSGNMEKRYGAVYVNRTNHDLKDLRRIPKKSFYRFKKVFESDGEDLGE